MLRGRSIGVIAAASVYGVCRCNGPSQLRDDIVAVPKITESQITNAYKTLDEELGLPAKAATPRMYRSRLAADLNYPDRIRRRARALAEAAEDADILVIERRVTPRRGEMSPPDSPTPAAETVVGGVPKGGVRFRSDGARSPVHKYH